MATAQPTVVKLRAPQVWFPQLKPFTSANGDLNGVLRQLSDLLVPLGSMAISPGYARSTALQGPGWGMVRPPRL
jgi:hypothetical protein